MNIILKGMYRSIKCIDVMMSSIENSIKSIFDDI